MPSRVNRVGDADAVDLGQAQVHAGHVGDERADLLERIPPVAHLRDQLELGPGPHGADDALAEERVVVGDDHAEPGHSPMVDGFAWRTGIVRSEDAGGRRVRPIVHPRRGDVQGMLRQWRRWRPPELECRCRTVSRRVSLRS